MTSSNRICQREKDESNIYRCSTEENPLDSEDKPRNFNEGDDITLIVGGDFVGHGCSFEINNITFQFGKILFLV